MENAGCVLLGHGVEESQAAAPATAPPTTQIPTLITARTATMRLLALA